MHFAHSIAFGSIIEVASWLLLLAARAPSRLTLCSSSPIYLLSYTTNNIDTSIKHQLSTITMGDWQAYIDNNLIGSGYMHSAAIIGLADGSYWAYGGDYIPQPDEITHIQACLKDPSKALASGVTIATVKYLALRATPGSIILKKGGSGGCIFVSKQTIVIGIYGNPEASSALASETAKDSAASASTNTVNPADCNKTVEDIAKYLASVDY